MSNQPEVITFGRYDLDALSEDRTTLYRLGGGVLHEMADLFGYRLETTPTPQNLFGLVGAVGPEKELQRNIAHVVATIESRGLNAVDICGDWLQRTGAMASVSGAFCQPHATSIPERVNATVWSGGVANWQLRRLMVALRLKPQQLGEIILPLGDRRMGSSEHQLVATYFDRFGEQPTECEFAVHFIVPMLKQAGHKVSVLYVPSTNGDAIYDALFREHKDILGGTTLVVGNAPNTIQATAQLRAAARRARSDYDLARTQLYMVGDSFPIALHGEDKSEAQNPMSGIGQIARNVALLCQAALNG